METSEAGPVLVATSLSARDDRAIDRAAMLAQARGTELIVVHVLKPGSRLAEDPERALIELREVLPEGALACARVRLELPVGSAPGEILRLAGEHRPDLIVTGVARLNDLSDFFLGTSVEFLLRHVRTPVLVVKRRPHRPYGRMLAATDLSQSSARALIAADALFPAARLRVIHGWHVPFPGWQKSEPVHDETESNARKALIDFLADRRLPEHLRDRIEPETREGGGERAVLDAIDSFSPDVLVLGAQGGAAAGRGRLGTIAAALLSSAPCDTLVVPG